MRLSIVLLFATAVLALAGASTASADAIPPPLFGKITYSSGGTCASGVSQLFAIDYNSSFYSTTTSLKTFSNFCGNSWPDGNFYVCPITISYNAVILNENFYEGDHVSVYARMNCSGGGYHFSPVHYYDIFHTGTRWWGGTFQLSSYCQTIRGYSKGLHRRSSVGRALHS